MYQSTGKIVILIGLAIAILGVVIYFAGNRFGFLGRLPGDIRIEKENGGFYFPIVTCLVISVILTLVVRIIQWLMR